MEMEKLEVQFVSKSMYSEKIWSQNILLLCYSRKRLKCAGNIIPFPARHMPAAGHIKYPIPGYQKSKSIQKLQ